MTEYTINITRGPKTGWLVFKTGNVTVNTQCWWDLKMVIDAKPGGFTCVATTMATKKDSVTGDKRPGIWFGKGISYNGGTKKGDGAFIHEGHGSSWSDGCIVIKRDEMMKLLGAIDPKGEYNIQVNILDSGAGA